jgi:hypothetical protein
MIGAILITGSDRIIANTAGLHWPIAVSSRTLKYLPCPHNTCNRSFPVSALEE